MTVQRLISVVCETASEIECLGMNNGTRKYAISEFLKKPFICI